MPADHSSNSFCMRNEIGEGDDCGADAALVGNNTYNINLLLILFSSIRYIGYCHYALGLACVDGKCVKVKQKS